MKTMKFVLTAAVVMLFVACAPQDKESYLEQFDEFMTEVSENCEDYTEEDWVDKTEKYEKFVGEWYDKFRGELTMVEELKVASYQTKWFYCKSISSKLSDIKETIEGVDVEYLKRELQYYIENDMIENAKEIYGEAISLGKEAEDAVREVLNEMEVEFEDLHVQE